MLLLHRHCHIFIYNHLPLLHCQQPTRHLNNTTAAAAAAAAAASVCQCEVHPQLQLLTRVGS
jgi:hypothetical protein